MSEILTKAQKQRFSWLLIHQPEAKKASNLLVQLAYTGVSFGSLSTTDIESSAWFMHPSATMPHMVTVLHSMARQLYRSDPVFEAGEEQALGQFRDLIANQMAMFLPKIRSHIVSGKLEIKETCSAISVYELVPVTRRVRVQPVQGRKSYISIADTELYDVLMSGFGELCESVIEPEFQQGLVEFIYYMAMYEMGFMPTYPKVLPTGAVCGKITWTHYLTGQIVTQSDLIRIKNNDPVLVWHPLVSKKTSP
jgi:hypothetical protein